MPILSWGHAVFAATMIALGVMGLVTGDFTPVWLPVPKGVPAREGLVYLSGIVALGSGMGLLWRPAAAVASRTLLIVLLGWLLLLDVPHLFLVPGMQLTWAAGKTAAMVAAAWVLYSASDWSEFVVFWGLTAAAWVVADSYRGVPWTAVGKA